LQSRKRQQETKVLLHYPMNAEPTAARRPLPETPVDALGPVVREKVFVEDQTFVLARPSDSDKLLDNPAIRSAFAADEYMPYWVDLWPAARMLAKVIARETWVPGQDALEIGCGLGLPGIVALSRGLRVTFSDYDATALRFAADNARANGFHDFRTLQLDWRYPPSDLRVPVVLGSDLVYEIRNVAPLVGIIKQVLLPGGFCLLTDQDRVPVHVLRETLVSEGLTYTTQVVRAGEPGGRRLKGTLYRITHRPPAP
jgi:predicted nicotinamide N-methyase